MAREAEMGQEPEQDWAVACPLDCACNDIPIAKLVPLSIAPSKIPTRSNLLPAKSPREWGTGGRNQSLPRRSWSLRAAQGHYALDTERDSRRTIPSDLQAQARAAASPKTHHIRTYNRYTRSFRFFVFMRFWCVLGVWVVSLGVLWIKRLQVRVLPGAL